MRDDPLSTARGICVGLLAGVVIWGLLIVAVL